jgi:hypothetical protein
MHLEAWWVIYVISYLIQIFIIPKRSKKYCSPPVSNEKGEGKVEIKGTLAPDFKLIKPHTEQSITTPSQSFQRLPAATTIKPHWLDQKGV